eukprot:gene6538-9382_t
MSVLETELIQPKQLPDKYAVSSEAKTAINVAARVFVAYTTDLANTFASARGRKTVSAEEVIAAIAETDLPIVDELKKTLEEFRSAQQAKRQRAATAKVNKTAKLQDEKDTASGMQEGHVESEGDEYEEDDSTKEASQLESDAEDAKPMIVDSDVEDGDSEQQFSDVNDIDGVEDENK